MNRDKSDDLKTLLLRLQLFPLSYSPAANEQGKFPGATEQRRSGSRQQPLLRLLSFSPPFSTPLVAADLGKLPRAARSGKAGAEGIYRGAADRVWRCVGGRDVVPGHVEAILPSVAMGADRARGTTA
jgi:hypothetical protein